VIVAVEESAHVTGDPPDVTLRDIRRNFRKAIFIEDDIDVGMVFQRTSRKHPYECMLRDRLVAQSDSVVSERLPEKIPL
jgi:hypothetical protein